MAGDKLELSHDCLFTQLHPMYNAQKDWLGAFVIAALGAGIITSFAVNQGQNPLIALGITGFASAAAVVIDHFC